jgi:hypothetical protein
MLKNKSLKISIFQPNFNQKYFKKYFFKAGIRHLAVKYDSQNH